MQFLNTEVRSHSPLTGSDCIDSSFRVLLVADTFFRQRPPAGDRGATASARLIARYIVPTNRIRTRENSVAVDAPLERAHESATLCSAWLQNAASVRLKF